MVEINSKWAHEKDPIDKYDLSAYAQEHFHHDRIIFYSRMEQLRLSLHHLHLKQLRKVLHHKFPPDQDQSEHGQRNLQHMCELMKESLRLGKDPDEEAYLKAIAKLL